MCDHVASLEAQRKALKVELARAVPSRGPRWLSDKLRDLMVRLHPDVNPKGLDANRVVAELSVLRDEIDGGR